ncbi:MAG: xanthine dehydrogenase family protein subunit M [Candidatus Korobacteraceae bacterium]|jgi:xanthine dehydrogenase YagS FAD-binding subunit
MKSFKHINAATVEQASKLLRESHGRARLNAGGTDLLSTLKDKILPDYPETIINLKTISSLNYIREDRNVLMIGATAKLADIAHSPLVREKYPLLADAVEAVATPNIRNMATIGGNLCQETRCWYYRYPHQIGERLVCLRKGGEKCYGQVGDSRYHAIMAAEGCYAVCPSDAAVALAALNGSVVVKGGKGTRAIAVTEFYNSFGTELGADEVLIEVRVPTPPAGSKQVYQKFRLRQPIDFAIVSVASLMVKDGERFKEARLALGGVAHTPLRAAQAEAMLKDKVPNAELAEQVASQAVASAQPLSKNAYKVEEVKVLVKRAVMA